MPEITGQPCMMCGENGLTLREDEIDVPHFGTVFVLSMSCQKCGYRKSDLEPAQRHDPASYTIEVDSEEDMSIKIIKSGEATVKIPRIISIEPGPASNGYITNVEGLLNRVKAAIETAANDDDDEAAAKKKAKKLIKKINNVILGREPLKITVTDPSGRSAIISEKAQKKKA